MGLVRGGAIDYATKGIRINAVLPGGTLTPMLKGAMANDPGLEPALASVHPMNRFGQPEEIAAAVRFLISDDERFVTGAAYAVDGGHPCLCTATDQPTVTSRSPVRATPPRATASHHRHTAAR